MTRSAFPFSKSALILALGTAVLAAACAQNEVVSTTSEAAQAGATAAPDYTPSVGQEGKDVVWVPTPQALVDKMLEMAEATPQDKLVDLGSGDGRTVITAAQRGIQARGIEYNPDLVELSRRAAAEAGVSDLATFEQGDIFETDFSEADVVTLFLLSSLNLKLRPTLLEMEPGTRVVSNTFNMGEWQPDETVRLDQGDCSHYCTAHRWIVPAQVDGNWSLNGGTLQLAQEFQFFTGEYQPPAGGAAVAVTDGALSGREIRFKLGNDAYVGQVAGNEIRGTIEGGGNWRATRAAQ